MGRSVGIAAVDEDQNNDDVSNSLSSVRKASGPTVVITVFVANVV